MGQWVVWDWRSTDDHELDVPKPKGTGKPRRRKTAFPNDWAVAATAATLEDFLKPDRDGWFALDYLPPRQTVRMRRQESRHWLTPSPPRGRQLTLAEWNELVITTVSSFRTPRAAPTQTIDPYQFVMGNKTSYRAYSTGFLSARQFDRTPQFRHDHQRKRPVLVKPKLARTTTGWQATIWEQKHLDAVAKLSKNRPHSHRYWAKEWKRYRDGTIWLKSVSIKESISHDLEHLSSAQNTQSCRINVAEKAESKSTSLELILEEQGDPLTTEPLIMVAFTESEAARIIHNYTLSDLANKREIATVEEGALNAQIIPLHRQVTAAGT
jgi:hypothetical protein